MQLNIFNIAYMYKINGTPMENLATVLSHLMSKNGLTSSELARKTGIAQPVIYRLMSGNTENPQILTLRPIADYFGISIDQLLGLSALSNQKILDKALLHDITNKLSTIKTIASALIDILPTLTDGYQKAVSAKITNETTPTDILPLLQLNAANLLKTANAIQESLITNNTESQD